MLPKASQTDPNGDPKSFIFAKSANPNACEKKCAHNDASELLQDPLFPSKGRSRLHGSILFTCPLVAPKCFKMAPSGLLVRPFGLPNKPKVLERTL